MRFLFIKNEQVCYYCKTALLPNEEAVVIRIRHANNYVIPQFFHTNQCFEKWNNETFVNRLLNWRMSAVKRQKQRRKVRLGRPRRYFNGTMARRLIASIHYHKKASNEDRVKTLEAELRKLDLTNGGKL